MKKIKYVLVAAVCLLLPYQVSAGENAYIQASWSLADIGDANGPYRTTGSAAYSLDEDVAVGASLGWNLNKNIAVEMKLNYIEGEVTDIDGSAAVAGSQYNYAVGTIGVNYNIDRFTFDKTGQFAITPYVGAGLGADFGYLDAQKNGENNCGSGNAESTNSGCASGDNLNDSSTVVRASLGGLVELHKNIGLDLNYDYVWGTVDSHIASAGIRVMF